jgi:hypothetical protein
MSWMPSELKSATARGPPLMAFWVAAANLPSPPPRLTWITFSLSVELVIARSLRPSASKSPAANVRNTRPSKTSGALVNLPSGEPIRIATLVPVPAAMSSSPSASKSAATIPVGFPPTVTGSSCVKPPPALPRRTTTWPSA